MQAGKLRHRITIQKPVTGTDPFQTGAAGTWTNVLTCWAEIEAIDPRVVYSQGSENMQVSHLITIRYPKGFNVGSGYQALYSKPGVPTRVFSILKGILDESERDIKLQFLAWEINPSAGG